MWDWFTGTATGNVYNVGQVYRSGNGDLKVANSDGTFTNLRTGRVSVGSSVADNVSFGNSSGSVSSGVVKAKAKPKATGGAKVASKAPAPSKSSVDQGASPSQSGTGAGRPDGQVVVLAPGPRQSAGTGAGLGVVTASPISMTEDKPLERTGGGQWYESSGMISDVGWTHTRNGYVPVPSVEAKERMEDDIFQELGWQLRNNVGPTVMPWEFVDGEVKSSAPFPSTLGDPNNYTRTPLGEWIPKPGTVKRIGGSF